MAIFCPCFPLFVAFVAIVPFTEHLAVFFFCLSAPRPRDKLFSSSGICVAVLSGVTVRAPVLLFLVYLPFDLIVEVSERKMAVFAINDIFAVLCCCHISYMRYPP